MWLTVTIATHDGAVVCLDVVKFSAVRTLEFATSRGAGVHVTASVAIRTALLFAKLRHTKRDNV